MKTIMMGEMPFLLSETVIFEGPLDPGSRTFVDATQESDGTDSFMTQQTRLYEQETSQYSVRRMFTACC